MRRGWALAALLLALPARAVTPEAQEFMAVTKRLEPVQCEKRKLRREILQAEVEKRDADAKRLRARMAEINADPETARLEQRLAVLEAQVLDSRGHARNREDLDAISFQQRQAYYNCD